MEITWKWHPTGSGGMDDVIRHPIMWMDDDDSEVAERL